MRRLPILVVILISSLTCVVTASAQDQHFTQFYMSPLTLNPAHAGYFEGTARISGIYRDQGFGVLNAGPRSSLYTTPAVNVDAPILLLGETGKHWLGVGLAFYNDTQGSLSYSTTGFYGTAALHLGLGGSGKGAGNNRGRRRGSLKSAFSQSSSKQFTPSSTYLSIGLAYGSRSREFDLTGLGDIFGDEFTMAGTSMDRGMLDGASINTSESGIGVMLNSKANNQFDYQIGLSAFKVIPDEFRIISRAEDEEITLTAHAGFNYLLNAKWSIHPQLMYRVRNNSSNASLQGIAGYRFSEEKDVTLLAGAGYRFGDALQFLLGAKVKNLRVGGAFDLSTGSLKQSRDDSQSDTFFGAFELAAQYIIKIYKKPESDPVIFCPRL